MSSSRLLAGTEGGALTALGAHEAIHGRPRGLGSGLAAEVEAAGLRGHGGAAFPTAIKLRTVAAQRGPRTLLVNAAEGEPMSAKDRVLLALAPHLVLDGAVVAADAVGARQIVIGLREDAAQAGAALRAAVAERRLGRRVKVARVPVAYLAGQESALIRYLDSGDLRPTTVPPLPAHRGLRRRPTLVQNVETLAHLALIDRHGAAWFRAEGTAGHPGTTLLTVGGAVRAPGVLEVACGTPLREAIAAAGGAAEPLRAVLVGGYHGTWLTPEAADAVRLEDEHLAGHDATLAAGVVVALPASACPAHELAATVAWLADQSAHQCGPCANGLPALASLLGEVVAGRPPSGWRKRLGRWSAQLEGRGACHLPDGAVRFLASGVRLFGHELSDHAVHGPCDACQRPTTLRLPEPAMARRAA